MTPLGILFKSSSTKPKIDQHSLFTSIQVSTAVLQGQLQVYEPWRKKRNRPKECEVTLYANETSPFLVWHKLEKRKAVQKTRSVSEEADCSSSTPRSPKPRCVISIGRAKVTKHAGGSFELTDFDSCLSIRFIANTIREAEAWVTKLSQESCREAKLDMRSICSSCSSFSSSTSSFTSHSSPDTSPNDTAQFFPAASSTDNKYSRFQHRKSASLSDANGALAELSNSNDQNVPLSSANQELNNEIGVNPGAGGATAYVASSKISHARSNHKTFPRAQISKNVALKQQHVRAQPHLGMNVTLDKHRPDIQNVLNSPVKTHSESVEATSRPSLPFSEYFVNVPNT